MNKKELFFFRNRKIAFEKIDELYNAFLSANKRKTNVDLFYGEYWKPEFPEKLNSHYIVDYYYIVAYYDTADKNEVIWFDNYIKTHSSLFY